MGGTFKAIDCLPDISEFYEIPPIFGLAFASCGALASRARILATNEIEAMIAIELKGLVFPSRAHEVSRSGVALNIFDHHLKDQTDLQQCMLGYDWLSRKHRIKYLSSNHREPGSLDTRVGMKLIRLAAKCCSSKSKRVKIKFY